VFNGTASPRAKVENLFHLLNVSTGKRLIQNRRDTEMIVFRPFPGFSGNNGSTMNVGTAGSPMIGEIAKSVEKPIDPTLGGGTSSTFYSSPTPYSASKSHHIDSSFFYDSQTKSIGQTNRKKTMDELRPWIISPKI
jgi:hypothetical protein